jgi:hypothetical protein
MIETTQKTKRNLYFTFRKETANSQLHIQDTFPKKERTTGEAEIS